MNPLAYVPAAAGGDSPVMFSTAEEAWLWGVQGMQSRLAGAHVLPGMARRQRPCEASDVINCAARLRQDRRLSESELGVLFLYGRYAMPPHALGPRHRAAVPVWERALGELGRILEQKGIIRGGAGEADHD